MKICELKIKDMESVTSITRALLLSDYSIKSHTKFKKYPRETTIDYFVVEIYDHLTEKGGAEE